MQKGSNITADRVRFDFNLDHKMTPEEISAVENQVNEWIRSNSDADGHIDFDLALRDPSDPSSFRPGYDSGDHLHPSAKAYKAMADAVPGHLLF